MGYAQHHALLRQHALRVLVLCGAQCRGTHRMPIWPHAPCRTACSSGWIRWTLFLEDQGDGGYPLYPVETILC